MQNISESPPSSVKSAAVFRDFHPIHSIKNTPEDPIQVDPRADYIFLLSPLDIFHSI
jgi:hypothetical protein